MVADAKGYFADEGIKHRILDGGPGKNPVPIVGAGQADFGITAGGNSVFQARLAPDPIDVWAIGTLLQIGPYSYITLANPGDPEPVPKDIEGTRSVYSGEPLLPHAAMAAWVQSRVREAVEQPNAW